MAIEVTIKKPCGELAYAGFDNLEALAFDAGDVDFSSIDVISIEAQDKASVNDITRHFTGIRTVYIGDRPSSTTWVGDDARFIYANRRLILEMN